MKPKTIVITLVVCLVLIVFFVWDSSKRGASTASVQGADGENISNSLLTAPETLYDFRTISMKNGNVNKDFQVANSTNKDITVKTVITSCMCTKAFVVRPDNSTIGPFGMPGMSYVPPANEVIQACESRVIRVVYDPNAHGPAGVGHIDRFVTLTDSSGGTIQFEIKALVTP